MKKFLSLLVLLLPYFAQANTQSQQEWIVKISEYRSQIIEKNPQAILDLKTLQDKWLKLGVDSDDVFHFTSYVLTYSNAYQYDFEKIKKKLPKKLPKSKISESFDETDFNALIAGGEIIHLIQIGILESDYPFKLNQKAEIFKELEFYEINSQDRLADIGAGNGQFSFLLHHIYPDATLFITESSYLFHKYIEVQVEKSSHFFDTKNIEIVFGKKKNCRIEDKKVDKIVIRNSLHHFSRKDEMLQSIKLSLTDNGILFIKEATREMDKDKDICEKAMHKANIEDVLKKNGFVLVGQMDLSEETVFKYVKN